MFYEAARSCSHLRFLNLRAIRKNARQRNVRLPNIKTEEMTTLVFASTESTLKPEPIATRKIEERNATISQLFSFPKNHIDIPRVE